MSYTYYDPAVPGNYRQIDTRPPSYERLVEAWQQIDQPDFRNDGRRAEEAAGYTNILKWCSTLDDGDFSFSIEILRHEDGHLVVSVYDGEFNIPAVFVAPDKVGAFMMTALPGLMQAYSITALTHRVDTLDRTIRAFVRHGAGTDTIDEIGVVTKEERKREKILDEQRRRDRAARAAQAQTGE